MYLTAFEQLFYVSQLDTAAAASIKHSVYAGLLKKSIHFGLISNNIGTAKRKIIRNPQTKLTKRQIVFILDDQRLLQLEVNKMKKMSFDIFH